MATPEEKLNVAFTKLDTNKNDKLTLDEIKSSLTKHGATFDAAQVDAAFKALDKDGDGALNKAEFAALKDEPYRSQFLPLFEVLNK